MKYVSNDALKISDEDMGGFIEKLKDEVCAVGVAENLYRLTSLPTAVSIDVRIGLIEFCQNFST
jgi:hypothetical protein